MTTSKYVDLTRRRQASRVWAVACFLCVTGLVASAVVYADSATTHRYPEIIDPSLATVAAKQAELGTDVEDLFEYVRDNVRYEPYQGVLRGAQGTLLAQAGNAADQALLLHELLKKAGYESRFVHGTLEPVQAKRLIDSTFNIKPAGQTESQTDPQSAAVVDTLISETREQYKLIIETLVAGGFQIPQEPRSADLDSSGQSENHYWIQYRQGSEWTDLDPSFPDAKVGQVVARVKETMEKLPDRLFHRVTIRLVLEENDDGRLLKRDLLTYQSQAADLSGASLLLTHQEESWDGPTPMEALGRSVGGVFEAVVEPAAESKVKPVLLIGTDFKAGEAFEIQTQKKQAPAGLGGVLSELSGSQSTEMGAIAEWIEFEFHSPDGKAVKTQRTIFDRIGFAARQKGSQKASHQPPDSDHPLGALFCLSFYTGPLMNDAVIPREGTHKTARPAAATPELSFLEIANLLKGINHSVSMISDFLVFPVTTEDQRVIYATTSPRLIISTLRSSTDSVSLSIDLRRSEYRPIATEAALADKAFQLQVLRGVVDGVVERNIMNLIFEPTESSGAGLESGAYSTGSVFRESGRRGIRPVLLTGAPSERVPSMSAEPAARVAADISEGKLIIMPEKTVPLGGKERIAWWRIDGNTGATVGVTETGLHAAQTEYRIVVDVEKDLGSIFVQVAKGRWKPLGKTMSYTYEKLAEYVAANGPAVRVVIMRAGRVIGAL